MKEKLTLSPILTYSNSMEDSGVKNINKIKDSTQDKSSKVPMDSRISHQEELDRIDEIVSDAPALLQGKLKTSLINAFKTESSTEIDDASRIDEIRDELATNIDQSHDSEQEEFAEKKKRMLEAKEKLLRGEISISGGSVDDETVDDDNGENNENDSPTENNRNRENNEGFNREDIDELLTRLANIEEHAKNIDNNTRELISRLDKIIKLTEEDVIRLLEKGNEHLSYLVGSIERLNLTLQHIEDEAERQTKILEQLYVNGEYTRQVVEKADELLKILENGLTLRTEPRSMSEIDRIGLEIRKAQSLSQLNSLLDGDSVLAHYFQRVINDYSDFMEGKYGEVFGESVADSDVLGEIALKRWNNLKQEIGNLDDIDAGKTLLARNIKEWAELHHNAQILGDKGKQEQRRNRQKIENIDQLAEAIMLTHPDFAEGTGNELINKEGEFKQENFIKWIRGQLTYYHNQDPDNPQINFFSSINVDLPDFLRTVNIFTMMNNPGIYFRDKHGNSLDKLKDEVIREVWLFGDIRNKDIAYRLSMPLDERISEVLMNMYQNNVLTKVADEGKTPLYWLLTMSEHFSSAGKEDIKVGAALNESLLIYYNLTDFPMLANEYAGRDSPLFNLSEWEKAVKNRIISEGRDQSDTYFAPDQWARIRNWFDENRSFKFDDQKVQDDFIDFINIYFPEEKPTVIGVVRDLVQKTVQERLDLEDSPVEYAEQFAHFFLRFTLAAARADIGAPAMDAGEKIMRPYNLEKGANTTNSAYGNIKALGLRIALGLDFFAGTKVFDGYKGYQLRENLDKKNIDPEIIRDGKPTSLARDEEILALAENQYIDIDEDGKKVIKEKIIYSDRKTEDYEFSNAFLETDKDTGLRKIYHFNENGEREELWDEQKDKIKLLEDYEDKDNLDVSFDIEQVVNRKEGDGFHIRIKKTVRDWKLEDFVDKSRESRRVLVRRSLKNGIEIVDELSDEDKVTLGSASDMLNKSENIINVTRIFFGDGNSFYQLQPEEYLILSEDEQYYRVMKDGNQVGEYRADEVDVTSERYRATIGLHTYSTLNIMENMHNSVMENQDVIKKRRDGLTEEEVEERREAMNEFNNIAMKLQYKDDTMRQYSSNHLHRAFQMFHNNNKKHLFDIKSILKGYDGRKGIGWTVDEEKIQEIFTEQLQKQPRYNMRTYLTDMSQIIRGISRDNPNRFENMTVGEHFFGPAVLDRFRMSNGEIDWEFLGTSNGIAELYKTELILRLAAEESQLDDFDFPEPHMALQVKLAYRRALERAIASDQEVDLNNPSNNKFKFEFFQNRKISFQEDENKEADDYMDVYRWFTGKTERQLITEQLAREGGTGLAAGLGEAASTFIKEVAKG